MVLEMLIRFFLSYCLYLCLSLFLSTPVFASQKLIAVLDLVNKTPKFKVEEIYFLTDLIRKTATFLDQNQYAVITKDNILALLPPDRTLEECINECAIKTGQLLGADWIVTGQVIEFGDSYRISISLYSKTGVLADTQTISGMKIEDLETALKIASTKLLIKIDPNLAIEQKEDESELSFGQNTVILEVPKHQIQQGTTVSQINLDAEKRLERALDIDENLKSKPEDKMKAWCDLGVISSEYQAKAIQACEAWSNYVRAYEEAKKKLYQDFKTLIGYLQLKRKTMTQKKSAVVAFLNTYQAYSQFSEYLQVKDILSQFQGQAKDIKLDIDRDGIEDSLDQCPDQAEDLDGFNDQDGCLDADNDGDQVLDTIDKCPKEQEDIDQYQDQDGCPEFGPIDVKFFDQKMHALFLGYSDVHLNVGSRKDIGQATIFSLGYQLQSDWLDFSLAITVGDPFSFYGVWVAPYIPNEFYFGVNLISWPAQSEYSLINLSAGVSAKYYYFGHFETENEGNYCVGFDTGSEFTSASCDVSRDGLPVYLGFYLRNVMHLGCNFMASVTLDNMPVHITAGKMDSGSDFYVTALTIAGGLTFGSRCEQK
jgi:hypothetical protein